VEDGGEVEGVGDDELLEVGEERGRVGFGEEAHERGEDARGVRAGEGEDEGEGFG